MKELSRSSKISEDINGKWLFHDKTFYPRSDSSLIRNPPTKTNRPKIKMEWIKHGADHLRAL